MFLASILIYIIVWSLKIIFLSIGGRGGKKQDLNRFEMLPDMLCDILLLFMYVHYYKSSNTVQTLNVSKVPFALVIPFCS